MGFEGQHNGMDGHLLLLVELKLDELGEVEELEENPLSCSAWVVVLDTDAQTAELASLEFAVMVDVMEQCKAL